MNIVQTFQGKKIEILEMNLKNIENQLELSWKISFENTFFRIMFHHVSKFSVEEWSVPLEIQGFEIFDHSQDGWETEFAYEIRDFEDGRVHFFCKGFEID